MFADDLLMFSRADTTSVTLLFDAFLKWVDKSFVYIGGLRVEDKQALHVALGMTEESLPFRYLGVPLSSKKLSYVVNPWLRRSLLGSSPGLTISLLMLAEFSW